MKGVAIFLLILVILTSIAAGMSGVDELKEQSKKLENSPPGYVIGFNDCNVTIIGNTTIGSFDDGHTGFIYVGRNSTSQTGNH